MDKPILEAKKDKRDEWEIKEDYYAVKKALEVFKDKQRTKDVQDYIKSKKDVRESLDAVADGDLQKAIGLVN